MPQSRPSFRRVTEEPGRLDILVNNAATIHDALIDPGGFWEKPLALVDILDVGLRSAYVASYFAAPLMVAAGAASSCLPPRSAPAATCTGRPTGRRRPGSTSLPPTWPWTCSRTSCQRLAVARTPADRAHRGGGAQPPGPVRGLPAHGGDAAVQRAHHPRALQRSWAHGLSGQTLISAELAQRYGITEEGGRVPPSYREMLGAPRVPHPAKVM